MKKITALAFLFVSMLSFGQDGNQWKELLHAQEAGKRVQMNINDGNLKAAMEYAKNIVAANETLLKSELPANYAHPDAKNKLLHLAKLNEQLKTDLNNTNKVKENVGIIQQILTVQEELSRMIRQ